MYSVRFYVGAQNALRVRAAGGTSPGAPGACETGSRGLTLDASRKGRAPVAWIAWFGLHCLMGAKLRSVARAKARGSGNLLDDDFVLDVRLAPAILIAAFDIDEGLGAEHEGAEGVIRAADQIFK